MQINLFAYLKNDKEQFNIEMLVIINHVCV